MAAALRIPVSAQPQTVPRRLRASIRFPVVRPSQDAPEPRPRSKATEAQREHRRSLEAPARAAYAHLLDLGARGAGRGHAADMVRRILELLDRYGVWTEPERATLTRALEKWRARADGRDRRYVVMHGNSPGRTPETIRDRIGASLAGDRAVELAKDALARIRAGLPAVPEEGPPE